MLLKIEPLAAAIEKAKQADPEACVILPTPRGVVYKQSNAKQLAADNRGLILICPRYEGYDERITSVVDKQISIGEYVLTGGELPAMIIADAVTRLIPGVLGGETSAEKESHSQAGVLEHPHYTRPEEFRGLSVPEVLLSGHHGQIEQWRKQNQK